MNVPTIDINLYGPEMAADPWPTIRKIRELGPIVYNERGQWITAHDRVCRQIMSRPDEATMEGVMTSIFGKGAFIAIDERQLHNTLRNIWVAAFGKNGVEKLVSPTRRIINQHLDETLDILNAEGQADMHPLFCRQIPAHVIAQMMGVGEDMIQTVIGWADDMASATSNGHPIDYDNDPCWLKSEQSKAELADFLLDQLNHRRANPGDDLISMVAKSEFAQQVPDQQLIVNLRQLLFAGNETTGNWLGHIVTILGTQPDLRDALNKDRSLIPAALEEVLRWLGVTHAVPRTICSEGMTIAGTDIPPGAHVMVMIGAAGRDPQRYENPDEFDIYREAKPHLAFGFGLHSCLGATLARMEALEATNALLDRMPEFHIAAPVTYGSFILRGPTRLLIEKTGA